MYRTKKDPEESEQSWEKGNKAGGNTLLWLQITPLSNNNQSSMVLAEKQINRPMEHNWEPWSGPIGIWVNNFWQSTQTHKMEKKKKKKNAFAINDAGKIG